MEPCKEDGPKAPISPYGDSKYQAEAKITPFINQPGNFGTSLRFFNVVGTAAKELLDNSVENLVPIVLGKLNKNEAPEIFGTDYPTPDGTCIRDYIHVNDLCAAHLLAVEALMAGCESQSFNLGNGNGFSILDIIETARVVTGRMIATNQEPRRAGDQHGTHLTSTIYNF